MKKLPLEQTSEKNSSDQGIVLCSKCEIEIARIKVSDNAESEEDGTSELQDKVANPKSSTSCRGGGGGGSGGTIEEDCRVYLAVAIILLLAMVVTVMKLIMENYLWPVAELK
jgi:hypothetical protein